MRCSCFAISLLLIISTKQNDGSWLSQLQWPDALAPRVGEAGSLEEMERIDPDLYQQVVATRPALLQLHKLLKTNLTLGFLRRVNPVVYHKVIKKYPKLGEPKSELRRRWKLLRTADPDSYARLRAHPREASAARLRPALAALRRADPSLYRQLVAGRADLADLADPPTPRTPPTFNDLRKIDTDLYLRVVEELQALDFEYLNMHGDQILNFTELGLRDNVTRTRRDNAWRHKMMYRPKGILWDYNRRAWPHFTGSFVQSCYDCGHEMGIPKSPICHDAFESPDWRARTTARYYRSMCHRNTYNDMGSYSRKKPFYFDEKHFIDNRGLKKRVYGMKMGGCYKRFLDVGKVYTERGCRRWPPGPWYSNNLTTGNFASHRYRKLEYLLGEEKRDRCLFSPHASLTPFHRGISLFARYHVCVCFTNYCNTAHALRPRRAARDAALAVFATHIVLIFRELY